MSRLHPGDRTLVIGDAPDLLGDVFAWNKVFRRAFWDAAGLAWPEGVRYEDQPTSTLAYLRASRVAVTSEVVYRWRIRIGRVVDHPAARARATTCATAGSPSR